MNLIFNMITDTDVVTETAVIAESATESALFGMTGDMISWVLTGYIVLPFVILTLFFLVLLLRGRSRMKKAMRELIINVKSNENTQLDAIKTFLSENLGFSNETAETTAKNILSERKFFVRSFVSGYMNKDLVALQALDDELSRVTAKYHELVPEGGSTDAESTEITESSDSDNSEALTAANDKVDALLGENKSLKASNHKMLVTLNSIFTEYSSMFGEEIEQKTLSVDQILEAMSSFSGKQIQAEMMPSEVDTTDNNEELLSDDMMADVNEKMLDAGETGVDFEEPEMNSDEIEETGITEDSLMEEGLVEEDLEEGESDDDEFLDIMDEDVPEVAPILETESVVEETEPVSR